MTQDLSDLKLERVRAFVDAVRKRPNALIRQEGQTLAVADLEALLSALKEAREALKVSEALSSPGGQGNTEAQGCGTDGAVSCRGCQPESPASAAEAVSTWRCRACGARFSSAGGQIVGGQCPTNRPTCPLEPADALD